MVEFHLVIRGTSGLWFYNVVNYHQNIHKVSFVDVNGETSCEISGRDFPKWGMM